MMEIGRLDPGDIIDYQINKKGFTYALLTGGTGNDESRFIPPMRGQFYDIVPFWTTEPTVRKVYKVNIPMEKEMQFQFYQGECTSSMRYEDGRKAYTFVSTDIMPTRREPNMVDLFDAAPKLMMSSTPRWQDKSLWFNKVNEDYGSFSAIPEAQKKVDELIQGKKTEMEKIAVLTHWVADNIRYSGISMGKGEGYTVAFQFDGGSGLSGGCRLYRFQGHRSLCHFMIKVLFCQSDRIGPVTDTFPLFVKSL